MVAPSLPNTGCVILMSHTDERERGGERERLMVVPSLPNTGGT